MKKKRKLKFDEIQVIYLLNKKEVTYTDCVGNEHELNIKKATEFEDVLFNGLWNGATKGEGKLKLRVHKLRQY